MLAQWLPRTDSAISDEIFVRRIYLDMAGRVPTVGETRAFLGNTYAAKRDRLIEELLGSEGYVSHAYNYWADVLRVNDSLGNNGKSNDAAYRLWIKDALRQNKTYDQMVYELVSANGHIWENGAIGYYQRDRGMPLDNMANTVRVFLGTRLECAQCHNHPFDKWKQMDFYEMAAFSNGMDGNRYDSPNRQALSKTDFNSTIAYALGLSLDQVLYSPSKRPFTVASKGKSILEVLS